ncbi:hypothetical protein AB6T85_23595 [Erwinia sp. ACCC 02193]|uniref:Uncharacterized protein n=1 Tax=Erwinia aeris TaxID=3239803 RepID=A0ABV4EEN6_9GAMM
MKYCNITALPAEVGSRTLIDFESLTEKKSKAALQEGHQPPQFGRCAGLLVHLKDMAEYGRDASGCRYVRFCEADGWEPVTRTSINWMRGVLARSLCVPVAREEVNAVVSFLCHANHTANVQWQRHIVPRAPVNLSAWQTALSERFDGS